MQSGYAASRTSFPPPQTTMEWLLRAVLRIKATLSPARKYVRRCSSGMLRETSLHDHELVRGRHSSFVLGEIHRLGTGARHITPVVTLIWCGQARAGRRTFHG